jgi:hypothetical protein
MSWPVRKPESLADASPAEPPLTADEQNANLSMLEQRLNQEMKCTAGRNQVYIRALLSGPRPGQPRIALKCPLRRDIKLTPEVFYEHIQDVCCNNPDGCPAWRAFKARHMAT